MVEQFRLLTQNRRITDAFVNITIIGQNDAPVAAISGAPASLAGGLSVTLDGGGSSDVDLGETASLQYLWRTDPANAGAFDDAGAPRPVWTAPPGAGMVALQLVVTDAHNATGEASAMVEVTPAPAAILGARSGAVTENGFPADDDTASGALSYVNAPAGIGAGFRVQTLNGRYGDLAIAANGVWTYTLNNANAETDALPRGGTAEDTFGVQAGLDSATGNYLTTTPNDFIRITVIGVNDVPEVTITAPDPTVPLESASGETHTVSGSATDPDAGDQEGLFYRWITSPADTGVFTDRLAPQTTWTAPSVSEPVAVILSLVATDPQRFSSSTHTQRITVRPITPEAPPSWISSALLRPARLRERPLPSPARWPSRMALIRSWPSSRRTISAPSLCRPTAAGRTRRRRMTGSIRR